MPQGGCGKAHKISDDMIIDSDDAAVVDNHGTKELPVAPENNLVLDGELSNDRLPATVSIDKLQDAPGHHGIKWKLSALVPSKQTPAEHKHLFHLTAESIALTVITEDNSEHCKVTYHLKIASLSDLKKQLSKYANMAQILKVSQSLKFQKFQNSVTDIVAHVLGLSTLVSTYKDFQVLFTIACKVSNSTPLLSDEDYEIIIDNIAKARDLAVSPFICALNVHHLVTCLNQFWSPTYSQPKRQSEQRARKTTKTRRAAIVATQAQVQAQVQTRVQTQMGAMMGKKRGRRVRRRRRVRGSRSLRCAYTTDYKSPHNPQLTMTYLEEEKQTWRWSYCKCKMTSWTLAVQCLWWLRLLLLDPQWTKTLFSSPWAF